MQYVQVKLNTHHFWSMFYTKTNPPTEQLMLCCLLQICRAHIISRHWGRGQKIDVWEGARLGWPQMSLLKMYNLVSGSLLSLLSVTQERRVFVLLSVWSNHSLTEWFQLIFQTKSYEMGFCPFSKSKITYYMRVTGKLKWLHICWLKIIFWIVMFLYLNCFLVKKYCQTMSEIYFRICFIKYELFFKSFFH